MTEHIHSLAECDGVALIRYLCVDGKEVVWPVAASTCPMRPATEESLREHFARHCPGCTWVSVRVLTKAQWDREITRDEHPRRLGMTTLELAAAIARAVADAVYDSGWVLGERAEEQAHVVLRVLREHDSWFCRVTIDEAGDGTHGATHEAPYEQVQLEMWP